MTGGTARAASVASSWEPLLTDLSRSPLTPVLIVGPGAREIARRLHDMTHAGARAPFVHVDCTWLPAEETGRLLFGFEDNGRIKRGSVERASGGTLFLDDVAELPAADQARLAKMLDSMRFRRHRGLHEIVVAIRVVAAVRDDVSLALKSGRLRRDLHARLSVFPIVTS
ncbi:MAG TPA: sigma 54-interacting transcriptional regulator [Polyangiaceae bacterium]